MIQKTEKHRTVDELDNITDNYTIWPLIPVDEKVCVLAQYNWTPEVLDPNEVERMTEFRGWGLVQRNAHSGHLTLISMDNWWEPHHLWERLIADYAVLGVSVYE